jgi:hypothetical protein
VQDRRRKVPSTEGGRSGAALRWVEAVLETPEARAQAGAGLPVELPGGARMIVGDTRQAALAAELLRALALSPERTGC